MIKFLNYTIMKKLYFYLLLLPFWALGASSAWAQSVQLVGSNFDTGAVTFTVDVGAATPTWVLVEYTTNPSPNLATMSRATFTYESINPPSAGTLAAENRGFLLTSSATITAKLKDVSGRFSWCGYALGAPPNATVNPEGGYTLRGTPPFIINGIIEVSAGTFGPSPCIESFTDFTYNPGGLFPEPPAVTVSASETIVCPGTEVTFIATASGGTTSEMTYTWDVAGTTVTTTANTYSQILSADDEGTYSVRVTNAFCTSKAFTAGSITVFSAGTIATATVYTTASNAPASPTVHPTSLVAACAANVEYQWRRSGESAATLSDSNTPDYDLSLDDSNYATAGTYYFNRYAKNKAGDWVAAEGTYTLTVDGTIAPPPLARSTQLWPYQTSIGALVWSDYILDDHCTSTAQAGVSGCMRYADGVAYGYSYANTQKENLCPESWHLPSAAEWSATMAALFGVGACVDTEASDENARAVASFAGVGSMHCISNACDNMSINVWSNRVSEGAYVCWGQQTGTIICGAIGQSSARCFSVRCVSK
jgi:uncharacterized protein (TIGR02145 family)